MRSEPERSRFAARGCRETPRVRLASAGSSGARTQGGSNSQRLLRRPRTPHPRRSAAARRARGFWDSLLLVLRDELVERLARAAAHGGLQNGRPAEQKAGGPERLPRPAAEVERIAVLRDETVSEAKRGTHVVVDGPPRLRERVVG